MNEGDHIKEAGSNSGNTGTPVGVSGSNNEGNNGGSEDVVSSSNQLYGLKQPQRQDSISMFTNFNQPRFSTDASISSFLNISSDRPSMGGGVGGSGDLSQLGRGYSIVNNLWPQQMGMPSNTNTNTSRNSDVGQGQFTTMRRQSETLEPFMPPRFKTPTFSSKQQQQLQQQHQQQQQQQQQQQNPNNNGLDPGSNNIPQQYRFPNSQPSSKRNSIYFGPNDATDLEFFHSATAGQPTSATVKRDSVSSHSMKPPMIVPLSGGTIPTVKHNNVNNNANNNNNNNNNTQQQVAQNQTAAVSEFDTLFSASANGGNPNNNVNGNPLLNMRNNSLKFSAEDFDFQFKRRDSSVRATLDNQSYTPGPRVFSNGNNNDNGANNSNGNNNNGVGVMHSADSDLIEDTQSQGNVKRQKRITSHNNNNNDKRPHEQIAKNELINGNLNVDVNPTHEALSKLPNPLLDTTDSSQLENAKPLLGVTKVDQLMLMIQARKKGVTEKVSTTPDGRLLINEDSDILPQPYQLVGGVEKPKGSHGVKQHECPYCHRFFTQSTHLEVHIRSHIGYKPFQCEYCGKRFTQGGNLRTHQRLHTGEKPYECEICGKRFSRKGNLAAHIVTHQKLKPFICKLDGCNKTFTQLGNMKAHQNRFHLNTLNELTQRLAEMDPNENIPQKEKELLEYFASLYKNSNKGIKGRGKGSTRISPDSSHNEQTFTHIHSNSQSLRSSASPTSALVQSQPPPQMVMTNTNAGNALNPAVYAPIKNQQHQQQPMHLKNDSVMNYGYPGIHSHPTQGSPDQGMLNSAAQNALQNTNLASSASSAASNNAFAFSLDQPDKIGNQTNNTGSLGKGQVQFKNVNYKA